MHPELAPVAFIAAFSLFLTVPWHWRAGNVATLSIIIWLFVTNIIYAIDAVVWADNTMIKYVVWCDISTKILVGASVALPSACLCVAIHLERVASLRAVSTSLRDRRRRQLFEGLLCFGLPMIIMALHYVVQGHRFDIVENFGCRASTYYSIPGIIILWAPPLVLSAGSLIFSAITLRHFMVRRLTFAAHINSQSGLSTSHYIRLMLMSIILMFWSVFVSSYALWYTSVSIPLRPWTTWEDVHWNFSRIDRFPRILIPTPLYRAYYMIWWCIPLSTFFFVVFFAFGKEATDHYKKVFEWFKTTILRRSRYADTKKSKFLPSFVKKTFHLPTISKPTFLSSSNDCAVSLHSVPNSPRSMDKSSSFFAAGSDTESTYCPSYYGPKAIGSYSDLRTPASTEKNGPVPPYYEKPLPSPPAPITPPPRHPRLEEPIPAALTSPGRPLTYPSYHESQLSIPPMPSTH